MSEYKEIILTKGKIALVDAEDFERVSAFKWSATGRVNKKTGNEKWYARRTIKDENGKPKHQYLHRFVLEECKDPHIDHKDGDGLNCRKQNLRGATFLQNSMNKRNVTSKTGYKGVFVSKTKGKFIACIGVNGKQKHIGTFATKEDAAKSYDKHALEIFGEFASLNFPLQDRSNVKV